MQNNSYFIFLERAFIQNTSKYFQKSNILFKSLIVKSNIQINLINHQLYILILKKKSRVLVKVRVSILEKISQANITLMKYNTNLAMKKSLIYGKTHFQNAQIGTIIQKYQNPDQKQVPNSIAEFTIKRSN
ncbi:hypothetical protein TTHERM_000300259 (macronuclear) [Tetrahymena thermophila SB210]|uniref:Uncharacterized protein n=1 Tax=Tetrahymena thermophila (strain SB210) TaxID=312017 RepID=W7X695_TETTS|nr:hypothetical protein TTHERM_000300259 [Tetrahymena thermophila SB210]EWS71863.1 hypothetical protein TTHERM_000300259 [Tetrahymena thermophila SB210]|eukprot:XP_012655607.1 hypothetical protein TTHERM_000300259 [Tetrahymena thermophila SB210]